MDKLLPCANDQECPLICLRKNIWKCSFHFEAYVDGDPSPCCALQVRENEYVFPVKDTHTKVRAKNEQLDFMNILLGKT